jgi:hypothetical protein
MFKAESELPKEAIATQVTNRTNLLKQNIYTFIIQSKETIIKKAKRHMEQEAHLEISCNQLFDFNQFCLSYVINYIDFKSVNNMNSVLISDGTTKENMQVRFDFNDHYELIPHILYDYN